MDELLELERAGWRSLCTSTGHEFYAQTMTEDALMVLANGQVMTRGDVVEALAQAPPWASFEIDEPRVVRVSDDVATLVYVGTGHREEGDPFVGAMSSTYVRRDGGWKLALYQQTPIPT